MANEFDLITMGRAIIDLYAQEIGVPFEQIKSFAAYVGGSPANIAVGARRLGLNVALISGVGDDPVADFILAFLREEDINTEFVTRKPFAPDRRPPYWELKDRTNFRWFTTVTTRQIFNSRSMTYRPLPLPNPGHLNLQAPI